MSRSPDSSERFFFYNSVFDPVPLIESNCLANQAPTPGMVTNAFGVRIDPKFFPNILSQSAGTVEAPPIPSNWHADIAEFGAVFRAIELSGPKFHMVELGCGWGCWMNISGVVAKRQGKTVHVAGVEGDTHHIGFAKESMASNGFSSQEYTLWHGIATAEPGTALFPSQNPAGTNWGEKPIFDLSEAEAEVYTRDKGYIQLRQVPLRELSRQLGRIDLLHIDIQGGELDLIHKALETITRSVAYMMIGTHSRRIEGILLELLPQAGWVLEIERPAVINIHRPFDVIVDGVQGWRNPALFAQEIPGQVRQEGGLEVLETPTKVRPGSTFEVRVRITNRSGTPWGQGTHPVNASYHWLDTHGGMVQFEGIRSSLAAGLGGIPSGSAADVVVKVVAPSQEGAFRLKPTLVQEGIAWFDESLFATTTSNIVISAV